ncbi:iron ABC transporter permease [Tatumella sp. UBA2305]|uniref:iron ABC transporter permease n=1 Tax=Tatumella sp. UBA2305 TaxID=1947647 RepID=UPI0025E11846|nr:iron ABC transporter permease [Tatumella sp. UBA2305]
MRKSTVVPIIVLLIVMISLLLGMNTLHYFFPGHGQSLTPAEAHNLSLQSMLLFHYSFLPRVAVALLAGAALGLAGWLCQLLLKNPLAEPATLGIASGAQLGLTLATLSGSSVMLSQGLSLTGAMVSALIIFVLSSQRRLSPLTLLLTGLIIGLFCSALQNGIALFRHEQLQNLFIWSSGNLSQNDWSVAQLMAPVLLLIVLLTLLFSRSLNLLRLSDTMVNSLGGRSQRIRLGGLLLVTLASGWTVSQVGIIGFIGLFAPQICRLLPHQRFISHMLLVMLFGAMVLLACDQLSVLSQYAGYQFTAGNITAIGGIPLMLFIIAKARFISAPDLRPALRHTVMMTGKKYALTGLLLLLTTLLAVGITRNADGLLLNWHDPLAFRWPRAVVAGSCGALLAIGGVILQRLTANPLASPEVLGVNSGAACGVVLMLIFFPATGSMGIFPAALAGALLSLIIIIFFAFGGYSSSSRILLAGTALSALAAAVISLLLASGAPNASQIISWLSGSAWGATPLMAMSGLLITIIALPLSLLFSRWLTLLPLGSQVASSLGLALRPVTGVLLVFCAILSACATLLLGPMSFIGLLAPQVTRQMGIRHVTVALPVTALTGAVLMMTADTLGRMIIWPFQIPAGVMAVLLGTPVFVWLLCRKKVS